LIKVRVKASKIRLGDRLMGDAGEGAQIVMQVSARGGEVRLSHGSAETRLMGDPLVWVLRGEPRVIEEKLPHTVWRRSGPRRTQPWEGAD
jgi:hypothetical protein